MAELYYFNDNGTIYGFVAGFSEITFDSIAYVPTLIKRSGIKQSDNFAKTPLSFYFSRTHTFAKKVLHITPERPILARIIESDTGAAIWEGRILKATASLTNIEIICDSVYAANIRSGNRFIVSPQCQHVLYSTNGCKASSEMFRENLLDTTITATTVLDVPAITQPSGYYTNGAATFAGEYRKIIKHEGTVLYLSSVFNTLGTGTLSLFRGCNLTSTDCKKFNNLDNQLAFEFSPNKSPFKLGLL